MEFIKIAGARFSYKMQSRFLTLTFKVHWIHCFTSYDQQIISCDITFLKFGVFKSRHYMQQNAELGNVGPDQIFLHFWVHFPSPLPLQIKGVSADLLIARYSKRCTPLTIYQIQWILQHLLHSTYIFIWKLEKLVRCTLNALIRLTYSR